MGPKWTKAEATAEQAKPQWHNKRAMKSNGERMKYIINNPSNHEWYEAHTAIPYKNGSDGKPTGCTFLVFYEGVFELTADHINKGWSGAGGVIMPGNGDFKIGDEVVTRWIQEDGKQY